MTKDGKILIVDLTLDEPGAMPEPKATEPPMISAKAANIVFREKERYKAALEKIVALGSETFCAEGGDDFRLQSREAQIASEALKGGKP